MRNQSKPRSLAIILDLDSESKAVFQEALGLEVLDKVGAERLLNGKAVTELVFAEERGIPVGVDLGLDVHRFVEGHFISKGHTPVLKFFDVLEELHTDLAAISKIGAGGDSGVIESEVGRSCVAAIAF